MVGLKIERICVGELSTNCYIIYNSHSRKGVIVDPGGEPELIEQFLKRQNLEIIYLVLTHGHIDHIKEVGFFKKPFYIHKKDREFLINPELNFSSYLGAPFILREEPILLEGKEELLIDSFKIKVVHTPGHTPGSISLKFDNKVVCGDLLFFGSVGRTDIPLASYEELLDSIKREIFSLEEATQVYPGHGEPTTVERERKHNPFLVL